MRNKLSSVSMLAFVVHGMVGIRLLKLPRDIITHANNDAWLSILIGSLVALAVGFTFYWIGTKYPELNFSQVTEIVLGRVLGKLIMVAIAVYTIGSIGMGLRSFADSVKIFLLDKTPLYIIILIMLLLCTYCVIKGIRTISIVFDLLLPLVLGSVILLFLLTSTDIETKNLLPVLHKGAVPALRGAIEIAHPYIGIGIVGYIMPYFIDQRGVKRWIAMGVVFVTAIYLGIILLCIMIFGTEEVKFLVYPTIILSKAITLETEIFERAESLFMAAWIPITFTTLVVYYFASYLNLKALFETNRDQLIIYGHMPVVFIIALLPTNIVEVAYYLDKINWLALLHIFITVPIIGIATLIKTRGRKNP